MVLKTKKINLVVTDNVNGHRKEIRKLTFRALTLRRNESRNCGLCVVSIEKGGTTLLVGAVKKQQNRLVE